MNPYQINKSIKEAIVTNSLRVRPIVDGMRETDPDAAKEIKALIENFPYVTEPYLERIPFYAKDDRTTLQSLADDKVIEKETAQLFARYWAGDSRNADKVFLYKHQAEAAQSAKNGKHLLVSTGTGSGKTETFLIPVIDGIIRAKKARVGGGIQAMIMYPMNALVNDQLRRIRDILRCAEPRSVVGTTEDPDPVAQEGIPYAREITFGRYTGELSTEAVMRKIRNECENNLAECKQEMAQQVNIAENNKMDSKSVRHPDLSSDSCIRNEYTSRHRWAEQPADILITNFAMLERLLLDPDKDVFFAAGTWRYIVLDEAHSYDGAMGTEIAWLIRRLVQRVSKGNRGERQFIATSATMGNVDAAKRFAAALFNQREEDIALLEGEIAGEVDYPTFDLKEPRSLTEVVKGKEEKRQELREFVKKNFSVLFASPEKMESDPEMQTLLSLTRWFYDFRRWLSSLGELAEMVEQASSKTIAFGDFVAVAGMVEELDPKGEWSFSFGVTDTWKVVREMLALALDRCDENFVNKCIKQASAETLISRIRQRKDVLQDRIVNAETTICISPSNVRILAHIVCELCSMLDLLEDRDEEQRRSPMVWKVCVQEAGDILKEAVRRRDELSSAAKEFEKLLLSAWQDETACEAETIGDCITARLTHSEILYKAFASSFASGNHLLWSDVARKMGMGSDEFDAFLQLLPLSNHGEKKLHKPLMDLRYHQAVKGISGIAVYFERGAAGKMKPVFSVDDERSQIHGNIAYALGCCKYCGRPYILGYTTANEESINIGEFSLSRYPSERRVCRYVALSWTRSGVMPKTYLNPITGVCSAHPGNREDCVPIDKVVDESGTHTCAFCGGRSGENSSPIIPFNTSETITKNVVLYNLTRQADCSFAARNTRAGGRKVLAFSDSRAGAASLVMQFGQFMEDLLLDQVVINALQGLMNEDRKVEMEIQNIKTQLDQLNKVLHADCPEAARQPLEEDRDRKEERLRKLRLPGIGFRELASRVREELEKCEAHYFLEIPYRDAAGMEQIFSEEASAQLATLAVLRSLNRRSLIRSKKVSVFSEAQLEAESGNTRDWQGWIGYFNGDKKKAKECFNELFQRIYLHADLFIGGGWGRENEGAFFGSAEVSDDTGEPVAYIRGRCRHKSHGPILFNPNQNQANRDAGVILKADSRNAVSKILDKHGCNNRLAAIKHLKRLLGCELNKPDRNDENKRELILGPQRFVLGPKSPSDEFQVLTLFRVEEHTAQISKEVGQLYQGLFSEGFINVLSCSTTFEMGVDLGDLNCVFLANMPPTAANYTQRAGRAGRRSGSASYVLTFMGSKPHDRYYRDHPEDLFFAKVDSPKLYMNNCTYRSCHLRAVAMHNYLRYYAKAGSWKTSGKFFLGYVYHQGSLNIEAGSVLGSLERWRQDAEDRTQQDCEEICGKLDYCVKNDLVFQLIGGQFDDLREFGYRKLAGPNQGADDNDRRELLTLPLVTQYERSAKAIAGAGGINLGGVVTRQQYRGNSSFWSLVHLVSRQSINELSQKHVLPLYGFPCDVIEMTTQNEQAGVELSRPKKLAIYEYAVGNYVIANGRAYRSEEPVFYMADAWPEEVNTNNTSCRLNIITCPLCGAFFEEQQGNERQCPKCGNRYEASLLYVSPDGFRADEGNRIIPYTHFRNIRRGFMYKGERSKEDTWISIEGTSAQFTYPVDRTLTYLNTLREPHTLPGVNREQIYGFFHRVQTDILLIKGANAFDVFNDNIGRKNAAWCSAAQAYARAAALVLGVNEKEVSAFAESIAGENVIVLFDDTSNGAGVLLGLFASEDENKAIIALRHHTILRKALELCTECDCYKSVDDRAVPYEHEDYLQQLQEENKDCREYTACYKCLKSYNNQREHYRLDAHDAAVIIRGLLGEDAELSANEADEGGNVVPPVDQRAWLKDLAYLRNETCSGGKAGGIRVLLSIDGKKVEDEFVAYRDEFIRCRQYGDVAIQNFLQVKR